VIDNKSKGIWAKGAQVAAIDLNRHGPADAGANRRWQSLM
jgi:hypothetical protein